jgi:hypothetical protein
LLHRGVYSYTSIRTVQKADKVPVVVSTRVHDLAPLVAKWIKKNPGVPTSKLVYDAIKEALKPLAGKRHAEIVEGN